MAVIRRTGSSRRSLWYPKTESTALALNSLAVLTTGKVVNAASTDLDIVGVIMKKIAATDSDFASATPIPVELIDPEATYEIDVTTGTLLTTSVGGKFDLDSTTGLGVNVNGTSHKQVTCVGFISATKGLFVINGLFQARPAV